MNDRLESEREQVAGVLVEDPARVVSAVDRAELLPIAMDLLRHAGFLLLIVPDTEVVVRRLEGSTTTRRPWWRRRKEQVT